MTRRLVTLAVIALSAACSRGEPAPTASPGESAPALASAAAPPVDPRPEELLRAAYAQDTQAITDRDVQHHDPAVRRLAARALARSRDPQARQRLAELLADGDADVLAWAAYGLGQLCAEDRVAITRQLTLRAASLMVEPPRPAPGLDPWFALARALGDCRVEAAERTLVSWLDGPKSQSVAAAYALADLAAKQKRLEEETAAALLRAASGDAANPPIAEAFYPFSRLARSPPRAEEHLFESLRGAIGAGSGGRIFVVRSLALLSAEAVPILAHVLRAPTGYTPEERAEAARALGKVDAPAAQRALLESLEALSPPADPAGQTVLVGPGFGPLQACLEALQPQKRPTEALLKLASLAVPPQAPEPLVRRVVLLRCLAASRAADASFEHPALLGCDPRGAGRAAGQAQVEVLGRAPLKGKRLMAWAAVAKGDDPVVRMAALELISTHPEIPEPLWILAEGLSSSHPGVVATAASQIALNPSRVFTRGQPAPKKKRQRAEPEKVPMVHPAIAKALMAATARDMPLDASEARVQLARALGAVRLESGRAWVQELCKSPHREVHEQAKAALALLDPKAAASCSRAAASLPDELERRVESKTTLRLDTDVGELLLTLDPHLAPVSVTRLVELSRKSFFDGMAVHRVVPGYVVQFGDRAGTGHGGADAQPLPLEASPVSFGRYSVGIAHGPVDSGSSQVFVTLVPGPHLDGKYAWIGSAQGPWDAVAEGDIVRKVVVEP